MTYSKRYAGGFVDSPSTASPIDSTFLNAVETALVALFGVVPTTNGSLIWNGSAFTSANLIANAQIDPAAAIAKTKLAALNIGNSDVAGAAAIARSKLDFGSGLVNADIATGAAIASSKLADPVARGLYRKTTSKAVNTTVAATDLLNGEITIAAGAMGTTGVLRLTAFGDMLNTSGGTIAIPRFQLVLGGTTLFDTNAPTAQWTSSATRYPWRVCVEIVNQGSASVQAASLLFHLTLIQSSAFVAAFTTGEGGTASASPAGNTSNAFGQGYNTAAVNTAVSQTLVLNVINGSANASCETKLAGALVEVI